MEAFLCICLRSPGGRANGDEDADEEEADDEATTDEIYFTLPVLSLLT